MEVDAAVIELALIAAGQLALIVYLQAQRARERDAHIDQIDRLCQRIQAPDLATAEHASLTLGDYAPQAIAMDDDEGYWESKEQLAQRLATGETSA